MVLPLVDPGVVVQVNQAGQMGPLRAVRACLMLEVTETQVAALDMRGRVVVVRALLVAMHLMVHMQARVAQVLQIQFQAAPYFMVVVAVVVQTQLMVAPRGLAAPAAAARAAAMQEQQTPEVVAVAVLVVAVVGQVDPVLLSFQPLLAQ